MIEHWPRLEFTRDHGLVVCQIIQGGIIVATGVGPDVAEALHKASHAMLGKHPYEP